MRLEILNNFNFIKQGDTKSEFKFKLLDYDDIPIDLTDKTVTVVIANSTVTILQKTPLVNPEETGVISFSFNNEDVTGYGDMRLEVHIKDDAGDTLIIPSKGYYKFVIEKSLSDITGGISSITLKYFEDRFDARIAQMESAINETQNAKFAADQAAEEANAAATNATEKATELESRMDNKTAEIEERVNQAIAAGTQDLEVKDARAGHVNLKARLDSTDTQLAQTVQEASVTNMTALNATKPLFINTFDGSYEPYHPSVKYFPAGWNGYKYWMAYTPYPAVASPYKGRWECPSIAVSVDGKNWVTPTGLTNPLIDLTAAEITNGDYFSDPSIVMNGATMEVWYRKTNGANTSQTDIYRMTSTNGTTWTAPEMVVDSQNVNSGLTTIMRAQQLFYDGVKYRSYWCDGEAGTANSRKIVFAETTDPSSGVWSNFTECTMINPPVGYNPWHQGIYLDGTTYHATVYDQSRRTVDYFKSTDGVNFTFIKTILTPTSLVTDFYQSYPLKIDNKWLLFAGITKNDKHGLMLFESADLIHLEGVNGSSNETDSLIHGDVILANNVNEGNTDQKIFATEIDGVNRYGLGMNLQKKYPIWFMKDYLSSPYIATMRYGNTTTVTPDFLGQFIKDSVTGLVYVSIDLGGGNYVWRPIVPETVSADKIAATSVSASGTDILLFNPAADATIDTITGGVNYKKIILTNKSNFTITLTHSTINNGIMTKDKANYSLLSGSSVQLIAIPQSGLLRWNVL